MLLYIFGNINKLAITKSLNREIDVWLVLVIIIASERSIKVIAFIIVLTIDIGLVFIGIVGVRSIFDSYM